MSALKQIKGLILNEMKATNPELRKAITNVINSIDSDLDVAGYQQSSDVDTALEELDNVLILAEEDNKPDEPEDIIFHSNKHETPEPGYRDLSEEV